VTLDTLELVRTLEAAGMPAQHAGFRVCRGDLTADQVVFCSARLFHILCLLADLVDQDLEFHHRLCGT